jgi:hypothetical protein
VQADGGGRGPGVPAGSGHAAALINLLALPLRVRDLVFLGRIGEDSPLSGVAGGGAASLALYIAVIALCVAIILARYRSVEA